MNQQCSAAVKCYIKCSYYLPLALPNSCPQPKSPLINRLINDRLLNA